MDIFRKNNAVWKILFYRLNFLICILQGGYVLFLLLSISGDLKNAFIFGLSTNRLLIISIPAFFIFIGGYLLGKSWLNKGWIEQVDNNIRTWLACNHRSRKVIIVCTGCIVIGLVFLRTVSSGSFYILAPPEQRLLNYMVYYVDHIYTLTQPYLIRFQPLVLLISVICAQILIITFALTLKVKPWFDQLIADHIHILLSIYGLLLVLWNVIGRTQLELYPDYGDSEWLSLGAPILDTQVALAIAVGFVILCTGILINKIYERSNQSISKRYFSPNIDLVLGLLIWIIATFHWLSIPSVVNKFLNEPRYPNYAYYPNSDAFSYDTTAQNLLVGVGFKTRDLDYPRRPVYALFLAILFNIVGQNYESVMSVQSAILAVFPVLVYLLTTRLYNRLSALMAAIFVILREGNAIALAGTITDTNSKLFMSEVPTALGIALLALIIGQWMRQPKLRTIISMLVGGIIALFMLIRIEVAIYLPLFILFTGVPLAKHPKRWIANTLLATLGAVLFLVPWIWRNWRISGGIYLEQPGERLSYFLTKNRFDETGTSPANETALQTLSEDKIKDSLIQRSLSHYINSQVQSILLFPNAYRGIDSAIGFFEHGSLSKLLKACCSRGDYVSRLYPLWHMWNGELPEQSIPFILINLLIIVVGFIKIWEKQGKYGVFLLLIAITYYFASSVVRVSGGRFVQIVDWIWIVFYSVGLGNIMLWMFTTLLGLRPPSQFIDVSSGTSAIIVGPSKPRLSAWIIFIILGSGIFVFGTLLPLSEFIFKPRYTLQTKQQSLETIKQSKQIIANYPNMAMQINNIILNDSRLFQGRALYPRYYRSMESDSDYESWNAPRDFDRFSFYLVGPNNTGVIIPLDKQPEFDFPHAADVFIIGCQDDGYLKGLVVYIETTDTIVIGSPTSDSLSCPD